jgi:hypothetical protein
MANINKYDYRLNLPVGTEFVEQINQLIKKIEKINENDLKVKVDLTGYITALEVIRDFQKKLVSGVNIKTINGETILGSGNIMIKSNSGEENHNCLVFLPVMKKVTISNFETLNGTDKEPFTHFAKINLTEITKDTSSLELINDNPVLFTKHGFAVNSVTDNTVEIYSIGKPENEVVLNFEIYSTYSVYTGDYTEE